MTVQIRDETIELLTYVWGQPDPNPPFQRRANWSIYPYPLLDDIREEARPVTYRALVVENEYLRVTVLPQLGGRLFSATDKLTGREVFYRNNVVKPGLIALRGAWISGGVEWNFPRGHTVTTVSPVDARMVAEEDGSATIWVGNVEQVFRMAWTVGLRLRPGVRALETEIKLTNRTALPHPYYFWANAAVPARDDMRMVYPGTKVRTWGGTYDWPVCDGRDLAHYTAFEQANDVFLIDSLEDFFGVYYEKLDSGLVHVADVHQSFGKKFFTWGTAHHGRVWSAALSDEEGPYCEVQSGRYVDQTTWKMMAPHWTESWAEWWYPVDGIGGFSWANREAAVGITPRNGFVECAAAVTRELSGARVTITAGDRVLREEHLDLAPGAPFRAELARADAPTELRVYEASGREIIRHRESQRPRALRLSERPKEEKATPGGCLRQAAEAEARGDAEQAWERYERALMMDPACEEAALALGRIALERKPSQAVARLEGAVAGEPEGASACHYLGLAYARAGRDADALVSLWRAAKDPARAHAARVEIGLAEMRAGRWDRAADVLTEALGYDAHDAKARVLHAVALRRSGRARDALREAEAAQQQWPADRFALAEIHHCRAELGNPRLAARARNQLAELMPPDPDAWLELALDYRRAGCAEEVAGLLSWAVARVRTVAKSALVWYLLADTQSHLGWAQEAADARGRAAGLRPEMAFTHHWELESVLRGALEGNPEDVTGHCLLGELLYSQDRREEGLRVWQQAVALGGDFSVLRRNLAMAYQETTADLASAERELRRALELGPGDPRLYLELNEILERRGATPQERLAVLQSAPEGIAKGFAIAAQEVACCLEAECWDRAIDLLGRHVFHRWELEFRMRGLYVGAYLGRGIERFDVGDREGARADFARALEYPENLRVGKPPKPADARAHWCAAVACEALGDLQAARAHWEAAVAEDHHHPGEELALYRALSLEKLGRAEDAEALFAEAVALAQQCVEMEPREASAHFALGLTLKAMGRAEESMSALKRALELDPTRRRAQRLLVADVVL